MDLDGPRKSESMLMDVDDGEVTSRYTPCCDSVVTDSPGPSDGWMPSHLPHGHPFPGRECPPGVEGAPPPMTLSSSSPVNYVEEIRRLVRQYRNILPDLKPSEPEVTQRKRKFTDDASLPHITEGGDGFTDGARSPLPRRVRPRLRIQQDGEFSPLLVVSPRRERDPPMEGEDTTSAFHHPLSVTDPSCSSRRYFDPGPARDHDPRILQHSSQPQLSDLEDRKERRRSDSSDSLAEVALAVGVAPKHGRLSTLQDIWLPRPFEDIVYEKGFDAGPLFISTRSGRTSGPLVTHEPGGSSASAMPGYEPSSTKYFDKPMCDSPESIDPYEDGPKPPWAS